MINKTHNTKEEFLEYVEKNFKDTYELLLPISFNGSVYKKTKVRFKECNHITYLCSVGIQRKIKCKKCHPSYKKQNKSENNKKISIIPEKYWGVVYYTKIKNTSFYKIGISKNGVYSRFNEKYIEPIFEIPCKTKEEALGIEYLIMTLYDSRRIINLYENHKDLIHKSLSHTEIFDGNILGNNFDIEKFIKKIKRGIKFID